MEKRAAVIDL